MKVSQGKLVNLSVVELIELVHLSRGIILGSYAQSAINVRPCHLELVEEPFLS
jgi:hypothetical protein